MINKLPEIGRRYISKVTQEELEVKNITIHHLYDIVFSEKLTMSLSCFWENFKELPDQDHNGNANKKVNKEVQEALESLKEHIERDNLTFGSAFPRVDVLKNKAQNLVNALEQKPTIEKELERLEKNINEVE